MDTGTHPEGPREKRTMALAITGPTIVSDGEPFVTPVLKFHDRPRGDHPDEKLTVINNQIICLFCGQHAENTHYKFI